MTKPGLPRRSALLSVLASFLGRALGSPSSLLRFCGLGFFSADFKAVDTGCCTADAASAGDGVACRAGRMDGRTAIESLAGFGCDPEMEGVREIGGKGVLAAPEGPVNEGLLESLIFFGSGTRISVGAGSGNGVGTGSGAGRATDFLVGAVR